MATSPVIPVAAGCLVNARGEVLICQRPAGKIAAGKWEFPGGKIEPAESAEQALRRELREELGIDVREARPLIRVRHAYRDRTVRLDAWQVSAWEGEPRPLDFQGLAWVRPDDLPAWDLLAADRPIVGALRLPVHCIVTPPSASPPALVAALPGLPGGLLRLRLPGADDAAYQAALRYLAPHAASRGQRLTQDRDPGWSLWPGISGYHATAAAARVFAARPVARDRWFGVSCHDASDLEHARRLDADYALLGPVRATATHPGAPLLGWPGFEALAAEAGLPVYAIGGLGPQDLANAWAHGAQGVAGISAYWRVGSGSDGGDSGSAGIV